MRRFSSTFYSGQVYGVLFFVFSYFLLSNYFAGRGWGGFISFILTFIPSIIFFYTMSFFTKPKVQLLHIINTFSFTLIPTLIWFYLTLFLFISLPPPRSYSSLGIFFSIVYICLSVTIFLWKLTLLYLGIRFNLKTDFTTTIFLMILYGMLLVPYSYGLYFLSLSRIPFI